MNVSPTEAPALLNASLQRLAAQSAACKLWSIVLTSGLLGLAMVRGGDALLAWAAAPVLLLALADAAYLVQARRIAALAAKETVRAEDLFRLQSGSAGFAASIQTLGGLTSFSVWPFYTALATLVIVLGQTVLLPSKRPQFMPQNSSPIASPFQPNSPRPANSAPPMGVASFPPSPNPAVNRPNMPPLVGSASRPNFPGTVTKPSTVPGGGISHARRTEPPSNEHVRTPATEDSAANERNAELCVSKASIQSNPAAEIKAASRGRPQRGIGQTHGGGR